MGKNAIIPLDETLVSQYVEAASQNGRSLEEELRAALALDAHRYVKDTSRLLRLSDEGLAMTPPDGPVSPSDSTLLIRWDRDTNHGKWIDDGWNDDGAGR